MKVLITGASGFLGFHLARLLETQHDVTACYGKRSVVFDTARAVPLDFTDATQCMRIVAEAKPSHVIHAGALSQSNDCEKDPEKAYETNVTGTRNMLGACATLPHSPHFINISTDLVFDGSRGNYAEGDETGPLMVYGRTKLEAERECERYPGDCAIVRSALIYGPLNAARPSFLDWMLKGIKSASGTLFADEFRSPVYVKDLCGLLLRCCEERQTGLFHCGGPERLSRYDFGLTVAKVFGLPLENVRKGYASQTPTPAPRPRDVSLNIAYARERIAFSPMTCSDALVEIRTADTGQTPIP